MTVPATPLNNAQPGGPFTKMKPAKTFNEQISILRSRGLIIADDKRASNFLARVNYYRFSGYAKLFYKSKDQFEVGTKIEDIIGIYYFDCELRNLLNEIMADIEISLRTQIAYNLGLNVGAVSYADASLYENKDNFNKMMEVFNDERNRKCRDPMVSHYSLEEHLPIWVVVEIVSLGTLSKLFSNLKPVYRKLICNNSYYSYYHVFFENYMSIATTLRNRIAHRERIYGKYFPKAPMLNKSDKQILNENNLKINGSQSTLFMYMLCIKHLLLNKSRNRYFANKLEKILKKYPMAKLENIGFPDKWENYFK